MGEDKDRVLFVYCGGQQNFDYIPDVTVALNETESTTNPDYGFYQGEFYASILLYKISRKRLIKTLMATGVSRNKANAIARTWNGHYARNMLKYSFTGKII